MIKEADGEVTTIEEMKAMVKQYGGKIVNSVDLATNYQIMVITERELPVSSQYLSKGIDLVKPIWIYECIKRGCVLQLEPYFIFASKIGIILTIWLINMETHTSYTIP